MIDTHSVLEYIKGQRNGRMSFKHLARELRVRGKTYSSLSRILAKLIRSGDLVEFRRGHYSLTDSSMKYIAGRFSRNPAGYGFVTPDRILPGVEGDIFISPDSTLHAMHLDRVIVRLGRIGNDGRVEGSIQRVINRKKIYVVGIFRYAKRGSHITPYDTCFGTEIQVLKSHEIDLKKLISAQFGNTSLPQIETMADLNGWVITIEITASPTGLRQARGQIVEILGQPTDFGIDVEIIIRKHRLPHRFPSQVETEIEQINDVVTVKEQASRRDFRDLDIITIDGESARDFDDAVWVNRLDNGNFSLQVHIADVSHYVRPGTALDEEAQRRGTSVYFPDRVVPMLPAKLSTGICSLNPGVDRLVISALLEIDDKGEVIDIEFCRGIIRSVERMTYENVSRVLKGDQEQSKRYQPLIERFRQMEALAKILNRRRKRRGAIDFDLPDTAIKYDKKGVIQGISKTERNNAHRIIEEFMLAANEAVAQYLDNRKAPTLYRIHEYPDPKRLATFERLLQTFGHSLEVNLFVKPSGRTRGRRYGSKKHKRDNITPKKIRISPHQYQNLINKLDGKPEYRVLSLHMLRSLRQARYSELNCGHFALATQVYTHFTSPIRRYPDLLVHRILTAQLDSDCAVDATNSIQHRTRVPYRRSELATFANETSFTERRAAEAERELIDWKKVRYMEGCLGDEFDAVVIAVMHFGLFVELEEIPIEGLIPVGSFTEERFLYREDRQEIIGESSGRRFSIGTHLRLRADRISYDRMRPEFSWIGNK